MAPSSSVEPTLNPTIPPTPAPSTSQPSSDPPTIPQPQPITPAPTPAPTLAPTLAPTRDPTVAWNLQLDLKGSVPDANEFYVKAAQRWQELIVGDVSDILNTANLPSLPLSTQHDCAYPSVIDDMYLCVFDGYIDGTTARGTSPNTLAVASTYLVRKKNVKQAFVGYAKFETADIIPLIQSGLFQTVVEHEYGHAMGIGELWNCPSQAYANSPSANFEFQQLSGCAFDAPTTYDGVDSNSCGQ